MTRISIRDEVGWVSLPTYEADLTLDGIIFFEESFYFTCP